MPQGPSSPSATAPGLVRRCVRGFDRLLARVLVLPVLLYRRLLSPLLPPACRYEPSCSRYALEALRLHGAVRGSLLTLRRLSRCHPLGGSGFDPVPPPRSGASS